MSNSFVENLERATSFTYTENGAICLNSTSNGLLDLFSTIGAIRHSDDNRKKTLLDKAVAEDKELAAKILFYGRDVREGLGERQTFRTLLAYAADKYPEIVVPNIPFIGEYGRYDDLYCLVDTKCEDQMWAYMRKQFEEDCANMANGKSVSLLAKWIKTPDASSKATRAMGIRTAVGMGFGSNIPAYKRQLKALRKYIDVVEIKVSAKDFSAISYEKVPSNAMTKYRRLFGNKDAERFAKYLEDVSSGKKTINASTLFPYDIVEKILYHHEDSKVLEAQWNALPNYVEDGTNVLVMADVSGSMMGRPMASSIGLAMYFAERAKGPFHNKFMTFSSKPELQSIVGTDLVSKIRNLEQADWTYNTDLDAAFDVILTTAVKNHTPAEEVPRALVIVSDMQIDGCVDATDTFYNEWKAKFESTGYDIPNVIFWNVNSMSNTFHADADIVGVQLLSGHATSTFKTLLENLDKTPVEAMMSVLLSDRYAPIKVAA